MSSGLPRIAAVSVIAPTTLRVQWRGLSQTNDVDLSQWIIAGGTTLAPLCDPDVFAKAALSDYGSAVSWDEGKGDLSVDAAHLRQMVTT
ncbi:MAG: hypothetical protein ACTHM2_05125 [Afipia sp.]